MKFHGFVANKQIICFVFFGSLSKKSTYLVKKKVETVGINLKV